MKKEKLLKETPENVNLRELRFDERKNSQTAFFENLITVEEVAVFLGFAPQTIKNWVAQRKIPFIRIGGKTRFCRKSVQAWVKRKEFNQCP